MTVLGTTWHKFIKHRYVYRETLPRRFLSSFLSLKKRERRGRKETVKISSKRTRVGEKKTERNVSVTRKNRCFFLFFFFISHSLDEDCKSCSWTCDERGFARRGFFEKEAGEFFPSLGKYYIFEKVKNC